MKLFAAIVALEEGLVVNVTRTCAEAGASRKTFYKWLARYREGGHEALVERSRRPSRSPGATPAEVEDWIVRKRKELDDAGLGCGAATIHCISNVLELRRRQCRRCIGFWFGAGWWLLSHRSVPRLHFIVSKRQHRMSVGRSMPLVGKPLLARQRCSTSSMITRGC